MSSSSKNAIRNAFLASLIRASANVLFSDRKVGDLFEPALRPKKKHLEKHHIFPRNYLLLKFKLDKSHINQVANFTYLEFEDNIDIRDDPPAKYFAEIKNSHYANKESILLKQLADHCLPEKFYEMTYEDFLRERRKLMAKTVRSVFESL